MLDYIAIVVSVVGVLISGIALIISFNQLKLSRKLAANAPFLYIVIFDLNENFPILEITNKGPGHAVKIQVSIDNHKLRGNFQLTSDYTNSYSYCYEDYQNPLTIIPEKTKFILEYENNTGYKFKDIWIMKDGSIVLSEVINS